VKSESTIKPSKSEDMDPEKMTIAAATPTDPMETAMALTAAVAVAAKQHQQQQRL